MYLLFVSEDTTKVTKKSHKRNLWDLIFVKVTVK